MLEQETDNLYLQMQHRLDALRSKPQSAVSVLSSSLEIVNQCLEELRKKVENTPFENESSEIHFFKFTKPNFVRWSIFLVEQFNVFNNIPKGTDEEIKDYYLKEVDFVKRLFTQNQFLYQYQLRGEEGMDKAFFLRKNLNHDLVSVNPLSPGFSTNHDYDFAKFRAYEMLLDYLLGRIKFIQSQANLSIVKQISAFEKCQWTDEKINLIELAYGIYFMGSLNHGKAEISDVVSWLEVSLGIDLGVPYRKFIDISRRKNRSFTNYLDAMRKAIVEHIEDNQKYRRPDRKH